MKTISIEIPDGKKAKRVDGVPTLVDEYPHWHKCEDGMPEPNVKVLCYTSKGTYFVAWTEITHWGLRWSRWNCPIIAWTELPKPPKFD